MKCLVDYFSPYSCVKYMIVVTENSFFSKRPEVQVQSTGLNATGPGVTNGTKLIKRRLLTRVTNGSICTQPRSLSHSGLLDLKVKYWGSVPLLKHRGFGHLVLHESLDVASPFPSLPIMGMGGALSILFLLALCLPHVFDGANLNKNLL